MSNKSTIGWVKELQQEANWNIYSFKKLKSGYPKFDFPEHLVDEVELEEFLLVEVIRLPLFIGSQFGIHPDINNILGVTEDSILVAILDKSLLSGHISGLSICNYKAGRLKEIEFFKN